MIVIRKNKVFRSYVLRNLIFGWPLILLALIPVFVFWSLHIYFIMGVAIVVLFGVIHNENRTRYFIEEVVVNGEDVKVIYYKLGQRHEFSTQLNKGHIIHNPQHRSFKWREPVLEIIDGKNHVIQFCNFGWTRTDFSKLVE